MKRVLAIAALGLSAAFANVADASAGALAVAAPLTVTAPFGFAQYAPVRETFTVQNVSGGGASIQRLVLAVRNPDNTPYDQICRSALTLAAGERVACDLTLNWGSPGTYTVWVDWLDFNGNWHEGELGPRQTFVLAPAGPKPYPREVPAVSGLARAGETAGCAGATWWNTPTALGYTWRRDGTVIPGATGQQYTLQDADVGHVLGCEVTASNAFGATIAPAPGVIPAARAVLAPTPLDPGGSPPAGGTPTPAASAPQKIVSEIPNAWRSFRRYTTVSKLSVRDVPEGAAVEVRCSGTGCPLKRRAVVVKRSRAVATGLFRGARLRPGSVVEVRVTKPGAIGKVLRFTIRSHALPRTSRLCLTPGSARPARC